MVDFLKIQGVAILTPPQMSEHLGWRENGTPLPPPPGQYSGVAPSQKIAAPHLTERCLEEHSAFNLTTEGYAFGPSPFADIVEWRHLTSSAFRVPCRPRRHPHSMPLRCSLDATFRTHPSHHFLLAGHSAITDHSKHLPQCPSKGSFCVRACAFYG